MTAKELPLKDRPMLRVHEAADYLGIKPNTASHWIMTGRLKKIPGTHYIAMVEIERMLGVIRTPKTPAQRSRGRYNLHGKGNGKEAKR